MQYFGIAVDSVLTLICNYPKVDIEVNKYVLIDNVMTCSITDSFYSGRKIILEI